MILTFLCYLIINSPSPTLDSEMKVGENMLQNEFDTLIDNLGVSMYVNDEPNSRKAIITSNTVNKNKFDDRILHTNFVIERGDTIKHNNVNYIVFSDVQAKRGYEYKSFIRPATNSIPIRIQEEQREVIGWTDIMQPIYGDIIQEEVIEDVPCIIEQETFNLSGQQIVIAESQIQMILGDNYKSQKVEMNDEYTLYDKTYKFIDINLFKKGLRIFTAERIQNDPS